MVADSLGVTAAVSVQESVEIQCPFRALVLTLVFPMPFSTFSGYTGCCGCWSMIVSV